MRRLGGRARQAQAGTEAGTHLWGPAQEWAFSTHGFAHLSPYSLYKRGGICVGRGEGEKKKQGTALSRPAKNRPTRLKGTLCQDSSSVLCHRPEETQQRRPPTPAPDRGRSRALSPSLCLTPVQAGLRQTEGSSDPGVSASRELRLAWSEPASVTPLFTQVTVLNWLFLRGTGSSFLCC